MELAPHLDKLRQDLAAAAAVGGEDVATAARLLSDAVEPALRLVLLDLLTDAAEELTTQLGGAVVEVRLQGRDPELVATAPVPITPQTPQAEEPEGAEGAARITLRLPESVKNRSEAAAAAAGVSLNAWLSQAVAAALDPRGSVSFPNSWAFGPGRVSFPAGFPFNDRGAGPGRRVTGFGRA